MTGKKLTCCTVDLPGLQGLDFFPDGKQLAAAAGREIWLISPGTGQTSQKVMPYGQSPVIDVACSTDGQKLAYLTNVSGESRAGTIDLKSGKERLFRLPTADTFLELKASPDSPWLIARSRSPGERLLAWSWDDQRTEKVRRIGPAGARSVSFLPDGQQVAIAATGRHRLLLRRSEVALWNIPKGRRGQRIFLGESDSPIRSATSPDGSHLAVIDQDRRTIRVLNLPERRELQTEFESPQLEMGGVITYTPGMSIAFAPDNQTVVTDLAEGHGLALWDTISGKTEVIAHGELDTGMCFSPQREELHLALCCENRLLIWNVS